MQQSRALSLPPEDVEIQDRNAVGAMHAPSSTLVAHGGPSGASATGGARPLIDEEELLYFESVLDRGRKWADQGYAAAAADRFELAGKIANQLAGRVKGKAAQRYAARFAQPYIELTKLAISAKDSDGAIKAAEAAVELAPRSSAASNAKGRAELSGKNYPAAIEAFSTAIKLNKNNVWAKNNLGYTALLQGDFAKAVVYLADATTQATQQKTAEGYMFNNLGLALEHEGRFDEARRAFAQGKTLGSKAAEASLKRLHGVEALPHSNASSRLAMEAAEPQIEASVGVGRDERFNDADGLGDFAASSACLPPSTFDLAFQCELPNGKRALRCADPAQARRADNTRGKSSDILSVLRRSWRSADRQ